MFLFIADITGDMEISLAAFIALNSRRMRRRVSLSSWQRACCSVRGRQEQIAEREVPKSE